MRDNSCRESIERILQDAPTARKSLLDNHSNLHRVADYCQNKYINVENTTSVIEESKALTTQALASVTYQINNLATSLLKLLDAQTLQLKQMESSVNMLSLTVDIYKENIARREIGVLTAQSKVPRVLKIVPPAAGKEPLRAYRRVPISFTRLDKLGHGHWENNKPEDSTDNRESFKQFSAQETSNFTCSFTGIAVPPPSVPDWVGSKVTASPDRSPASPSSFTLSVSSPSLTPYGFSDLSMLPPPPPPDNDTGDAPPPPPSPPASNMPSFPPNTYVTSAIPSPIQGNRSIPPPPPPNQDNMFVPPPPPTPSKQNNMFVPPPPTQGNMFIPPPPPLNQGNMSIPPPPNQGNMSILPPPPPPPPNQGNMSILPPPPPPPPNQGNMSNLPPPPPPPPNQGNMSNLPPPPPPSNQGKTTVPPPPQSISMVPLPPPPPPTPGGKFVPPPPPPLPPFKC